MVRKSCIALNHQMLNFSLKTFKKHFQANVLGKGVSHIVGDFSIAGGEPSVYSISNLIRKLRLEDGGTVLKPTPARAQAPTDSQV